MILRSRNLTALSLCSAFDALSASDPSNRLLLNLLILDICDASFLPFPSSSFTIASCLFYLELVCAVMVGLVTFWLLVPGMNLLDFEFLVVDILN